MLVPSCLLWATLLAPDVHVTSASCVPTQLSRERAGAYGMASEVEDLLATTVLAVAVTALHKVHEEARTTTARTVAEWDVVLDAFDDASLWPEEEGGGLPKVKRTRVSKARTNWHDSAWWKQLQNSDLADHTTDAAREFRQRFRVPHPLFLELVKLAKAKKWFSNGEMDAARREGIPLELKVRAVCMFHCPLSSTRRSLPLRRFALVPFRLQTTQKAESRLAT